MQKGARDSKRKGDIDAIAKAYEVKYNSSGSYPALTDADFASGKPKDPNSAKGDYFNWLDSTGAGFKVCASLEANPNDACNTPATNCYCMVSAQGTVNSAAAADPSGSTQIGIGFGGSSSPSCDPNGTLLSGLVGYWRMDETSWNGTAGEVKDSSGYGNNGSAVNGAAITAGQSGFGNAGSFNGTTAWVNAGNSTSLDLTTKLTLSAWVNYGETGTVPRWPAIVFKGNTDNYELALNGSQDSHPVGLYAMLNGTDTNMVVPGTSLPPNTWVNLIYTWDGTTGEAKAYFNGNPDGTATGKNGTLTTNTSILAIGANPSGSSNSLFKGLIDDVRIYNRVLSSSEISSLYNSGSGCLP